MLRVLTYRPKEVDPAVLVFPHPPTPCLNIVTPRSSLGALDIVPLELLHEILLLLQLSTLTSFRILNTYTISLVDALPHYKHIATHAPGSLHALLRTGAASHFNVAELFDMLCTPSCTICGKFGGFLFLPACSRCCMTCLRFAPELMPMTKSDAKAAFNLTEKQLNALVPVVRTLPGHYTLEGREARGTRHLVSSSRAEEASVAVEQRQTKSKAAYVKRLAARSAKLQAFDRHGRLNTMDHIYRFMSATPFPYWNRHTRTAHIGISCSGCQIGLEQAPPFTFSIWLERRDEMYTEDGFFDHFKVCRHAQEIWELHQNRDTT